VADPGMSIESEMDFDFGLSFELDLHDRSVACAAPDAQCNDFTDNGEHLIDPDGGDTGNTDLALNAEDFGAGSAASLGQRWHRLEAIRWRIREIAWILRYCQLTISGKSARKPRWSHSTGVYEVLQEVIDFEGSSTIKATELLGRWTSDLCAEYVRWQGRAMQGTSALRNAIKGVTMAAQVHPTVHLSWDLRGIYLFLLRNLDEVPMVCVKIGGICGGFMAFENQAGSLELDVIDLTATHHARVEGPSEKADGSFQGAPKALLLFSPLTPTLLSLIPPANITGRVNPHIKGAPMIRFDGALDPSPKWSPAYYATDASERASFILRHMEINVAPLTVRLNRTALTELVDFFDVASRTQREKSEAEVNHEQQMRSAFLNANGPFPSKSSKSLGHSGPASSESRSAGDSPASDKDVRGRTHIAAPSSIRNRVRGLFKKVSPNGAEEGVPVHRSGEIRPQLSLGLDPSPGGVPHSLSAALATIGRKQMETTHADGQRGRQPAGNLIEDDPKTRTRRQRRRRAAARRRAARQEASVLPFGLITIKRLRFGELNLFLSYKGETKGNLEAFEALQLKVHPLVYSKRTCTLERLLLQIRNDLIFDLLGQVHRNFNNIGTLIAQSLGFGSTFTPNLLLEEEDGDGELQGRSEGESSTAHRQGDSASESGGKADAEGGRRSARRSLPWKRGGKSDRGRSAGPQASAASVSQSARSLSPQSLDKRALLLGAKPTSKKRFWKRK